MAKITFHHKATFIISIVLFILMVSAVCGAQWQGLENKSKDFQTHNISFGNKGHDGQGTSNQNYYDGDFGDFDGDGRIDRALNSRYGILWNSGGGIFKAMRSGRNKGSGFLNSGGVENDGMQWADVDNDGDLDNITGDNINPLMMQFNRGARFEPTFSPFPAGGKALIIVNTDIENDGDVDLVTCHYFPGGPENFDLVVNDGNGFFSSNEAKLRGLPYDGKSQKMSDLASGDLDGDGDFDLVLGRRDRDSIVAINNGKGHYKTTSIPVKGSPNGFASGLNLGDIDGDGDLDIVSSRAFSGGTEIGINNGSGKFTNETSKRISGTNYQIRDSKLVDIDYDGDLDLVGMDKDTKSTIWLRIYTNNGKGKFTYNSSSSINLKLSTGAVGVDIDLMDLDRDGVYDVWGGLASNDPQVLINTYKAPDGLPANLPRNFQVKSSKSKGITLSWNHPAYADISRSYRVYRSTSPHIHHMDNQVIKHIGFSKNLDERFVAPITRSTKTAQLNDPDVTLDRTKGKVIFIDRTAQPGITYYYSVTHLGGENIESIHTKELSASISSSGGADKTDPDLNILSPTVEQWSQHPRIVLQYADGGSGINPDSLKVSFNRALSDGTPANTNLANLATFQDNGTCIIELPSAKKLPKNKTVTMTASIKDNTDNKNSQKVSFQVTVSSASKPNATIKAKPTSGNPGMIVKFDGSKSSSPKSNTCIMRWRWYFGDGHFAIGKTASHKYTKPGKYTATLVVRDNLGNADIKTQTISVGGQRQQPTAKFTASTTKGKAPLAVKFDASRSTVPKGSITDYKWNFGDKKTAKGVKVNHTYSTVGNFTATLTVTDNSGATDTTTTKITVIGQDTVKGQAPKSNFTAKPTGAAAPLTVLFDGSKSTDADGAIAKYSWSFGDGKSGKGKTIKHTYTKSGSYKAVLKVTDNDGLTHTSSTTINLNTVAPTAKFKATPTKGTFPLTVSFDGSKSTDADGKITKYSWKFGDGQSSKGTKTKHIYKSAGKFKAILTITDNDGVTSSASKSITVNAPNFAPTAKASSDVTESLVGDKIKFSSKGSKDPDGEPQPLSYYWKFGDKKSSKKANPSHSYVKAGGYTVTLTVSDGKNSDTASLNVYILPPPTLTQPTKSNSLALTSDDKELWVVNPDSNTVSVVDVSRVKPVKRHEIATGEKPRSVALSLNEKEVYVTCQHSQELWVIDRAKKSVKKKIKTGHEPYGVAVAPSSGKVIVANQASDTVMIFNSSLTLKATLSVGRNPRAIAISADGKKVYVSHYLTRGNYGEVSEIDLASKSLSQVIRLAEDKGPNSTSSGKGFPNLLSSLTIDPSGTVLWVGGLKSNTNMGTFVSGAPLNPENRVRGLAAPIDIVSGLEKMAGRIDTEDADMARDMAFSPNGRYAYVVHQGAETLSVYDIPNRSLVDTSDGSPVPFDKRIDVGSAPQGIVLDSSGSKAYVTNFMSRNISVIDLEIANDPVESKTLSVTRETLTTNIANGKRLFYRSKGPRHSKDNYISCASCHADGSMSDGRTWDFTQFGEGLRNTIDLRGRSGMDHGPLHWSGNFNEIQDFENDIVNGFGGTGLAQDGLPPHAALDTRKANAGRSQDLDNLSAYVASLSTAQPSPHRKTDGKLTAAAVRGKAIFNNPKVNCASCHVPGKFTDSVLTPDPANYVLHDVGTILPSSGTPKGIDTPTLIGAWDTAPYLHDGSAATLMEVLKTKNSRDSHGATSKLTAKELSDLVAYLQQIDDIEHTAAPTRSDTTRPKIAKVSPRSTLTKVAVTFSEPVEKASAEKTSNYSIKKGISIKSASLGKDLQTVTLSTSQLKEDITYTLTISNVRDRASKPNKILSKSKSTFSTVSKPLVSNLSSKSRKGSKAYEIFSFDAGEKMYTDRGYVFRSQIPVSLRGQKAIRTANADKTSSIKTRDFMRFEVARQVDIYIVYTRLNSGIEKGWLNKANGWVLQKITIPSSLKGVERNRLVRKKRFEAGTIKLPGNGARSQNNSMYNVVIVGTDGTADKIAPARSDTTRPKITKVSPQSSLTKVAITFSERVEKASAEKISNYSINKGISIKSASLGKDLKTVTLSTAKLKKGNTYTLTVNNVRDRASKRNKILSKSKATFSTASKPLVSKLTAKGKKGSKGYELFTLDKGKKMYTDRGYIFGSKIPSVLRGQKAIRTANDDKTSSTKTRDFMRFEVHRQVDIYIVYTRINSRIEKDWLNKANGWALQKFTLPSSLEGVEKDRLVRKKRFEAGTVKLPGNGATRNENSMYNVVIVATNGISKSAMAKFSTAWNTEEARLEAAFNASIVSSSNDDFDEWGSFGEPISVTSYEDAEDGTTNGWFAYGQGSLENIFEGANGSDRSIKTSGDIEGDVFRLGREDGTDWNNKNEFFAEFSVAFEDPNSGAIVIQLDTNAGIKYLVYKDGDAAESNNPDNLYIGLGDILDGQWHSVFRDLEEDLRSVDPDLRILEVQVLFVYGSLMLDDVKLLDFNNEFMEN